MSLRTNAKVSQFSKLEILARQAVEGFITGRHRSPFHGFSVEFAEHKQYNKGESTRHIDWKLYAKSDRLYTKRYEEETNLRCQLVVDASNSMRYPKDADIDSKLQFACKASAALTHLLKTQRDAVGLNLFGAQEDFYLQPKSNAQHLQFIYSTLDKTLEAPQLDKTSSTAIAKNLHLIAERTHRRSLIIIFSDMLENVEDEKQLFGALQHLKYNKHEVILFHTYHKKTELDFDFPNRQFTFIDAETKEKIKVNPSEIKADYQKLIAEKFKAIDVKGKQYGIDFILAKIVDSSDQV